MTKYQDLLIKARASIEKTKESKAAAGKSVVDALAIAVKAGKRPIDIYRITTGLAYHAIEALYQGHKVVDSIVANPKLKEQATTLFGNAFQDAMNRAQEGITVLEAGLKEPEICTAIEQCDATLAKALAFSKELMAIPAISNLSKPKKPKLRIAEEAPPTEVLDIIPFNGIAKMYLYSDATEIQISEQIELALATSGDHATTFRNLRAALEALKAIYVRDGDDTTVIDKYLSDMRRRT